MNPFMLSPSERLDHWSEFRESLNQNNETDQFAKVAQYWGQCPFSKWSLDCDQPSSWLSVWEILFDGEYCRNSIAVCMCETLRISGISSDRMTLRMISDEYEGEFFVLIIDGIHVLNYSHGSVSDISELANSDTKFEVKRGNRGYSVVH